MMLNGNEIELQMGTTTPSESACIKAAGKPGCTMGYTLVTRVGGHEYRYTEVSGWVGRAGEVRSERSFRR